MDKKIFLKIDAVFFYMISIGGFLMSLFLIIASFTGILSSIFGELDLPKGVFVGLILFIILIYLVISLAYFFAAKYLWNSKKAGGIIGIVLSILGTLGSLMFLFEESIGVVFGIVPLLFEVVLLVFLILGWKELS